MKKLLSVLVMTSSMAFAGDAACELPTTTGPIEIITPAPAPPIPDNPFRENAKMFQQQLTDIHYRSKRNMGAFGYSEIEIMKALEHLIRLTRGVLNVGEQTSQGREAFYLMKQPLSYISHYMVYNPLFKHVVHDWDIALKTYQKMVKIYTGTDVKPSDTFDFNNPKLIELQRLGREFDEIAKHYAYQIKNGLTMNYQENHSLVVFTERFAVLAGKMHSSSMMFLTRKYEIDTHMKEAVRISKQITAIMMTYPNPYFVNSWEMVRGKANAFRSHFEQLMNETTR
jgi:hypothetical protein